jgi:hypothetical protein
MLRDTDAVPTPAVKDVDTAATLKAKGVQFEHYDLPHTWREEEQPSQRAAYCYCCDVVVAAGFLPRMYLSYHPRYRS